MTDKIEKDAEQEDLDYIGIHEFYALSSFDFLILFADFHHDSDAESTCKAMFYED